MRDAIPREYLSFTRAGWGVGPRRGWMDGLGSIRLAREKPGLD